MNHFWPKLGGNSCDLPPCHALLQMSHAWPQTKVKGRAGNSVSWMSLLFDQTDFALDQTAVDELMFIASNYCPEDWFKFFSSPLITVVTLSS